MTKRLLLCVYLVSSLWWGPTAEAAFKLDRADGSRPTGGLNLPKTAVLADVHWPVFQDPPKPRPVVKVQAAAYRPTGGYSDAFFTCLGGRESGVRALPCAAFCGRLQWLPSTWRNAGGGKYASLPQNASWEQEKATARSYLAGKSQAFLLSQWPPARHCLHLR